MVCTKPEASLTAAVLLLAAALGHAQTRWVGSWAASQQRPEPYNSLATDDLRDATLRQVVHLTIGGAEVRIHLSNRFGTSPLHFTCVHIAQPVSSASGRILTATDTALTFSGHAQVTVPAGADYISDPVAFSVAALSDLAITLHMDLPPSEQTGHPGSRATSYLVHGDLVSALDLPDAKKVEHWYFISGVDVAATPRAASVVVLGDSITDGHGATVDGNNRWPDLLARRLRADPATQTLAVLNQSIGGNRLLLHGLGPNALARFDHDVLAQAGVRYLIVLEGVNDLGMLAREGEVPQSEHEALVRGILASFAQIITRAQTHGIQVIGCTILPYVDSNFYHPGPNHEADRQAVNEWIRSPGHFDAFIDFDRVMRDPEHPDHLLPAFDSGDHLHPSPVGYAAMAEAVPLSLFTSTSTPAAAASQISPAHVNAEQDHRRILDLLHITSLRRGPDGDPKSPNAANFDESKVSRYPILPDPLVLKNGRRVKAAKTWWKKRRPEIVEDFDREIYGRAPNNTPKVNWEVTSTSKEKNGDVPVITKTLVGHVDHSSYPLIAVDIQLTLTTPANAIGPVPVITELGLSPESLAAIRKRLSEAQLAALAGNGPTWQQQVLLKGWGYATLVPTSVQADNGAGLSEGIIGLANKGQPRKLDDWGALRAWAWGASRALDYFETDKSVDAKRVGIEGLSRYGKAALVAMAFDSRFAIAFAGSSGAGGAKILRRTFGEQVENIASTAEYHWMAGNFLKYAGPLTPNDLPVDAHELIALCAPRPVFISSGSQQMEGGWVDAKGMFLAAVGAGPVYKLLGKRDLGTNEFPPIESALIDGDIAFRQHSGGHTTGPNWPTFLAFASRYFEGPFVATAPNGAIK